MPRCASGCEQTEAVPHIRDLLDRDGRGRGAWCWSRGWTRSRMWRSRCPAALTSPRLAQALKQALPGVERVESVRETTRGRAVRHQAIRELRPRHQLGLDPARSALVERLVHGDRAGQRFDLRGFSPDRWRRCAPCRPASARRRDGCSCRRRAEVLVHRHADREGRGGRQVDADDAQGAGLGQPLDRPAKHLAGRVAGHPLAVAAVDPGSAENKPAAMACNTFG